MLINLIPLTSYAVEVTVGFSNDIKSSGLKIKSIKYDGKGSIYEFKIEYESDAARGYTFFNPPSGDKFKKTIFNDGIKSGNGIVKIEAENNIIDSIEGDIVMKFWKNNEDGNDYISFSLKKASAENLIQTGPKILSSLPAFDSDKKGDWQIDLRGCDIINSFKPGGWWEKSFYEKPNYLDKPTLLVPMDSRCTASETGSQNYVFYRHGGWSWSIPYIAGLYALACQVSPGLTPEKFWQTALKTGDKITITKDGKTYPLGFIANPTTMIDKLKSQK